MATVTVYAFATPERRDLSKPREVVKATRAAIAYIPAAVLIESSVEIVDVTELDDRGYYYHLR